MALRHYFLSYILHTVNAKRSEATNCNICAQNLSWCLLDEREQAGSPLLLFVRGTCLHGHDVISQIPQQSYFYGVCW